MKTLQEEFEELAILEVNALERGLNEIKECNERMYHSLNTLRAYVKAAGKGSKVWITDKDGWTYRNEDLEYENIDKTTDSYKE